MPRHLVAFRADVGARRAAAQVRHDRSPGLAESCERIQEGLPTLSPKP